MSSIRTVTNVNGNLLDNDEWLKTKTYLEHNNQVPVDETETDDVDLNALYNKPTKSKKDPKVDTANTKDLRTRSLNQ